MIEPPARSLRFLDRDGALLRDVPVLGAHQWRVPLAEVSPWLVHAVVASEDRRFRMHPGVDPAAILRAAWQDARAGRVVSGGSTITQQYVRNVVPVGRTIGGKLAEAWLALVLESRLTKDDVLERYLGILPYGHNLVGVQAAARWYLGKDASRLNAAEAAVLAVIPRAPSSLDPTRRLDRAVELARPLLRRMRDDGLLDDAGLAAALAHRPAFRRPSPPFLAPHATTTLAAAGSATGEGPEVRTTLDVHVQALAERALRTHLRALGRDDVQNGAVVVADTQTGEVLALVGSRDFLDPAAGQVDGARSPRQPGSTLKPFLYAMALARGQTPASLLSDVPTSFTQAGGQAWSPRDHDRRYRGPVRLREALASSLNVPAARLLDEIGVAAFLDVLHALGFEDLDAGPDEYGLGLVLGDAPVRLAALVDAYATLGRGGVRRPLTLIRDGPRTAETRVFPATVAWMVSDILSDDGARGLTFDRHGVLDLPFRVAAKTGTSADHRDSWCVGYTPERTVGVWVGNMAGGSMEDVWGAQGAAPVFREVMLGLASTRRPAWPPDPPGIVRREVCPLSGGAPGPACPGTVSEAFPASAAPPAPCDLHRAEAGGIGDHGPSYHAAGAPLRIARPVDGEEYRLDPDVPPGARSIVLLAAGDPANGPARFRINGAPGPVCEVNVPCPWPARPGDHEVALEGVRGRVRITVR